MPTPLEQLQGRLSEHNDELRFVVTASQLRPRIGELPVWTEGSEVAQLAQSFMKMRSQPEGLYAGILVRILAAFERYIRKLLEAAIATWESKTSNFDSLPEPLRSRNLVLTGRALSAFESPRDHLTLNYELLIGNLATCTPGSTNFRLNQVAFSAGLTGTGPDVLDKALKSIEVDSWWDEVCANRDLQTLLETKRTRDAVHKAKDQLKDLSRWRNQIAHAGDEEIVLTAEMVNFSILFIKHFSSALDASIAKRLSKR